MKLYPKSQQPLIYLSGGTSAGKPKQEREWIKRSGCTHRCYSYAYTGKDAIYYSRRLAKSLKLSINEGVGIMMDSGAHSFHKMLSASGGQVSKSKKRSHDQVDTLKDEFVKGYMKYVHKEEKLWDFYVTFDYRKHCPTIFKMQNTFRENNLNPVPVYHGDKGTDWLLRYVDMGCKLICIGSIARPSYRGLRYYFDQVFKIGQQHKLKFHGLAFTSLALMYQYPWYSVDSATWVKVSAFGKIIVLSPYRNVITQVHISDQASSFDASYNNFPKEIRKHFRQQVEVHGFDFDLLRRDLRERCTYNAYMFNKVIPHLKEKVSETSVRWANII